MYPLHPDAQKTVAETGDNGKPTHIDIELRAHSDRQRAAHNPQDPQFPSLWYMFQNGRADKVGCECGREIDPPVRQTEALGPCL